jgi:hypothetical protein
VIEQMFVKVIMVGFEAASNLFINSMRSARYERDPLWSATVIPSIELRARGFRPYFRFAKNRSDPLDCTATVPCFDFEQSCRFLSF